MRCGNLCEGANDKCWPISTYCLSMGFFELITSHFLQPWSNIFLSIFSMNLLWSKFWDLWQEKDCRYKSLQYTTRPLFIWKKHTMCWDCSNFSLFNAPISQGRLSFPRPNFSNQNLVHFKENFKKYKLKIGHHSPNFKTQFHPMLKKDW